MIRERKWLLITSIALGIVCSVIVVLLWYRQVYQPQAVHTSSTAPSPTPTATPTPDPLRPRTALLLGYVGGSHDGGLLTDTMLLARADFKQHQLTLISIPRDLWVPIPNAEASTAGKINQLYALGTDRRRKLELPSHYQVDHGGLLLAQDVVSNITEQPIDYVFAINQAGLIAALGKLGPIPVTVPYAFTDEYFPIAGEETNPCNFTPEDIATLSATLRGFELEKQFTCRYETLAFDAGLQDMDASTAAKFVRSRHASVGGNDFGRSQRQEALIKGVISLLSRPTNWLKFPSLIGSVLKNVETTATAEEIITVAQLIDDPKQWQINSYQIDQKNALWETRSSDGQYILIDRAASQSAELIPATWATIRQTIADWITQIPAESQPAGDSADHQAP